MGGDSPPIHGLISYRFDSVGLAGKAPSSVYVNEFTSDCVNCPRGLPAQEFSSSNFFMKATSFSTPSIGIAL